MQFGRTMANLDRDFLNYSDFPVSICPSPFMRPLRTHPFPLHQYGRSEYGSDMYNSHKTYGAGRMDPSAGPPASPEDFKMFQCPSFIIHRLISVIWRPGSIPLGLFLHGNLAFRRSRNMARFPDHTDLIICVFRPFHSFPSTYPQ